MEKIEMISTGGTTVAKGSVKKKKKGDFTTVKWAGGSEENFITDCGLTAPYHIRSKTGLAPIDLVVSGN